jgi:hypothetical protein
MFCWVLQTAETIHVVQGLNCPNLTPRHSSVSKACLVTVGAISMKLGVRISHDTNESILRPFLARIVANLIQKFKTQSSAVTSQMTRPEIQDPKFGRDVANDATTSRCR